MRLDEDAPNRPPLAIDRQTLKEMESANESIGKQQFPDAIHHLQHVLDAPEDSWIEVPGPHGSGFQSAKRQASDRIGNLPAQARETYETEYGSIARQLLDEALRRSDGAQLAEVVSRYFHTRAGYQAAYALGNRLFDASMPLPAANQFERLRKSPGGGPFEPLLSLKEAFCWLRMGAADKSSAILAEMKPRPGGKTVTMGGHRTTIPEGAEATAWLAHLIGPPAAIQSLPPQDWMLSGGAPDRNASGGDGLPLGQAVWTQSLIRDRELGAKDRFTDIETTLEEYRNELTERENLIIPSGTPLVIGNAVVFRAFARLRAVDLRTGDPLWDFAERDRLYGILAAARHPSRRMNRLPISMESVPDQDEVRLFLNARAFRDMTYAGLSSDGERVFALLDLGFLGLDEVQKTDQNDSLGSRNQNVLSAVDLATGRLLWELGGTRSDRNRDLAGTFFLGCGLPMGSALYVMGELDGEISLFKLDAATGKRIWSQRLATPLGRLSHYAVRRLAGGNPSSAAGLLICPTTGGVVTAFDPASRMLAWEYRYGVNRVGDPRMWADSPLETGNDGAARWLDSPPLIADGAVLLTPRDSDDLICLNLADGTLRWQQQRGTRLFLAGASGGTVYVVGRSRIEALRLKDGGDDWSHSIAIPCPAGRGYRNGALYYLPLSTGDLATVDLRRGRIVTRTRFEEGLKPGNLVSAEGTVLMESAASLQAFRPTADIERSVAKTLEQHPDDAAALATRGELRLDRGQAGAGLDDLTRSAHLQPKSRAQSIAVSTVLENLRFDFSSSRTVAERLGPQITDPTQRVEFHRLMAAGLTRGGDLEGALDHELQLLKDDSLSGTLLPVGPVLKVQVAAIVGPELADFFSKADPDKRARLAKKIETWIAHLAEVGNVDQLRRAAVALQAVPVELDLQRTLISKLTTSDQAELVRQLTDLRKSADAKTAGNATARLARLLIDHHRADVALDLLSELGDRLKTVPCADGKTGGELSHAWINEPAVKSARLRMAPWPGSQWSVKKVDYKRPTAEQSVPINVDQHSGPFYRQWRFESRRATERGFTLAAIDPTGNDRWQLELSSKNLGLDSWGDGPLAVRVAGPLIEVALRRRVVVLDAFDGTQPPRVLWWRDLFDPHWSATNQARTEMGLIGLMTDDRVYYQIGSALCAADAVTGRTIWERRSIPFQYTLEGDQDYVIALDRSEPNDPSGLVLRGDSGVDVFNGSFGLRGPLGGGDWHGRRVARTLYTPRQVAHTMIDLVARKVQWSRSYSLPAWPLAIDDQEFAILDSGLTLHVHSTETGDQVFETTFDHDLNSPQLGVHRLGNRYILMRQTGGFRVSPGSPNRMPMAEGNGIWAIDRNTGKVAWSAPLTPPQMLADLPAQSPVLVLLRPVSRFESTRGTSLSTAISILDAKTGKTIYEGREETSADRINVRLDGDAHAVIVTTDKHRLEVTAKAAD
ncbi:MAG TPA: PQQ-binding-like beta-propeller repeat protein [Planctomycetaceae bacterium]|nr:PQQ-binding-like beta-propeller repeat protein [Planctomycetaceae bacterium]